VFLGRSTQQWLGLIAAASSTAQVLIVTMVPSLDPAQVAIVLGAITAFLGVLIAFIANTYTTPVNDPQLKAGTMVRVTDDAGTVVGHTPVPIP
jgi:hypothetical protein